LVFKSNILRQPWKAGEAKNVQAVAGKELALFIPANEILVSRTRIRVVLLSTDHNNVLGIR
jgi:hypothetical protein